MTSRVDQIPPPLVYSGSGPGIGPVTVGGGDSKIVGTQLVIGNTQIDSGAIGTTAGDLTINPVGNTIINHSLTVNGNIIITGSV